MEDPPKKFFRLAPGREVRLRYAYFVTCREVVKDAARRGRRAALHVRPGDARRRRAGRPHGRRRRSTGSRPPTRVPAEVRLYDHLFTRAGPGRRRATSSPTSTRRPRRCSRAARSSRRLAAAPVGETVQFERLGYFCADPDRSPGHPVFNRTLTLKDTWAKLQAKGQQDGVGLARAAPSSYAPRAASAGLA